MRLEALTTVALRQRPQRPPNPLVELAAFCELSMILADDPQAAIGRLLEIAIRLCNAGSAGLSLLQFNQSGESRIHWQTVRGALATHQGVDQPRDVSPCGLCLDVGATILIGHPERVFASLRDTSLRFLKS